MLYNAVFVNFGRVQFLSTNFSISIVRGCIVHKNDCSGLSDLNGDGEINITDAVAMVNVGNGTTTWQLKNGVIMQVIPVTNHDLGDGSYKGVVAEIIVDLDGNKESNIAGKDVFAFLLDASGILIPAGSQAHELINQNGIIYVKSYQSECKLDGILGHNLACTGKIADNGWNAKNVFK